jgi:ribosomal protein S18 acetylase RimI-like enzyme
MIRSSVPNDKAAILSLAVAAGLFAADETEALAGVLTDYFAGTLGEGHRWSIDESDGKVRGAIYYAPELMADRTWYVYAIAVDPECQGMGYGKALMQHVEDILQATGQRVLLVETSSLPKYERTQAFYTKCGYVPEARIRDFYTDGEDKIVFRKVLTK